MSVTPFQVPLTDIHIAEEDVSAVLDALAGGWPGTGPIVSRFENLFAEFIDSAHAVAVTSGSSALHLALIAAGVGPGDEVLVPGLTFVATAAAVRYLGATPVLCDIVAPGIPLLDPVDAAARITPRTKAMIPVHFLGYTADTEALGALCDEHGLVMIEDCAQSVGATLPSGRPAGTAGQFGCFSLFSKKQLCCGEGGIVTTDSARAAELVRALRGDDPLAHGAPAIPMALDDAHAALALSRLPRLREDLERRRDVVRTYRRRLASIPGLELGFDDAAVENSSHFAFTILLRDRTTRDAVRTGLAARGVQTTWYPSLTSFSAYADAPHLPACEEGADRHVALPLSSGTTSHELDAVIGALRGVLGGLG